MFAMKSVKNIGSPKLFYLFSLKIWVATKKKVEKHCVMFLRKTLYSTFPRFGKDTLWNFIAFFWPAILHSSHLSIKKLKNRNKNFNWTAMPWHLRKQVGVTACRKYSASVAFLRVRRINIELK